MLGYDNERMKFLSTFADSNPQVFNLKISAKNLEKFLRISKLSRFSRVTEFVKVATGIIRSLGQTLKKLSYW